MRNAPEIEAAAALDPLTLFDAWLQLAEQSEPNDPNAAALATATPQGLPSVRMVLIKPTGPQRFAFYTNAQSRKGSELTANPHAALCLHWKSLRRQVRIEGPVSPLDVAQTDRYFHSRSRNSQIAAAISDQSRPLESRQALEERFQQFAATHPSEIPRPPCWQGFYITPETIEFWLDAPHRLHNRFLFTHKNGLWQKSLLYP